MEYLAKSNPKETIQEHTDNLLKNYKEFKDIYPDIDINWELLYLSCLYHDMGKMNKDFQNKIRGKKIENEVPHAFLSAGLIPKKEIISKFGKDGMKILTNSIIFHHERKFKVDINTNYKSINEKIKEIENEFVKFEYDKVDDLKASNFPIKYYSDDRITDEDGKDVFYEYIKVKGMLNRIDYASSAYEMVEYQNNFLEEKLNNLLDSWKQRDSSSDWNELQKYMIKNRNENIIAVAQTGAGKTEAALLWIGNNKGFFTLPLKVAINAIYDRIRDGIVKENIDKRVGMLHSDSFSEYIKRSEEEGLSRYFDRTKLLSLPLTITTLDQLFDFVYKYRGFELKLATLSYSKIVIDEIQMYSSDLVAYLIYGLKFITEMGGKFCIVTATFPPVFKIFLEKERINFISPSPFIEDDSKIRHSLKVLDGLITSDFIIEKSKSKNKILVICNTVKTAQKLYKELKESGKVENLNLIHSYFTKEDRQIKEDNIMRLGHKDCTDKGIWIGTQILEASLDIDFDILITELSDINGLFQRLGRCYRKRYLLHDDYNAFVFTGGEERIRGIGFVVDKDIFKISKEIIKNIDGPLSESKKIDLINETYTMQKLKGTKYVKDIEETIDYLHSIYVNEKNKTQVRDMFRNINNISIIPREIFNRNLNEINKNINILKFNKETNYTREEKVRARTEIDKYKISIPYYSFNHKNNELISINEYESLNIYNCNYDKEEGFTNVIEDKLDNTSNIL
ncbi:CRISPR-associated helicase/endonuclease Cas3 [Tissierella creatinophila]|uniref:CRISPR-associated nuclease/helicase Cas3 n=1 Tax=Tissierella creatinophila DSM 6911 TaxID=1123403 RepID=A0A1U7M8S3_TISCR|nr:CRISPR-associated helicase/endonuclease Cas3 [Tissierella creatinophila]OLS03598.1 CRISPR-associated nuclease/helicase Cas3 [Tissierella creatinophila DSM 6911]